DLDAVCDALRDLHESLPIVLARADPQQQATLPGMSLPVPTDYYEEKGALYWRKPMPEGGTRPFKLLNATARIVAEVLIDDGTGRPDEAIREVEIEGQLEHGPPLPASRRPTPTF